MNFFFHPPLTYYIFQHDLLLKYMLKIVFVRVCFCCIEGDGGECVMNLATCLPLGSVSTKTNAKLYLVQVRRGRWGMCHELGHLLTSGEMRTGCKLTQLCFYYLFIYSLKFSWEIVRSWDLDHILITHHDLVLSRRVINNQTILQYGVVWSS